MLTTATAGEGENVVYVVETWDCYFREQSPTLGLKTLN